MATESTLAFTVDAAAADGPAVVLLHSLAMDRTIWDGHVAELAGRFPIVRCDLPGHGESAPIDDVSVEDMADQVAALLDEQPWSRYVVVGLSLGGCVAQSLVARRPDLVAALGLVDTTAWYGADAPAKWEERALRAIDDGMGSLSQFQLDRWFSPEFRTEHPEVGERLLSIFRANDVQAYADTCRAMGRFDGRSALESVAVPTSILVGELDPATPVASAQVLHDGIAGSTLRILPGAMHMSPLEQPESLVVAIAELHATCGG